MPASVIAAFPNDLKPSMEAQRRFDCAMILLNDVVEVGTAPDENILPLRIFPAQKPQRLMTRRVPVERDLARPPRQRCGQCLTEECLCRRNASIGTEQEVDGLAPLIDGAVEVVPLSPHRDVRLINPPG
jgi:hypothetical protein